jgi:transcriptional regulator with PAS, ATPase and Fis domain
MGVTPTTLWKNCKRLGITEDSFERDRITKALERYKGDLVRVCTVLRISRASLVERMARMDLGDPRQRRAKAESAAQRAQRHATLRALQKHKWSMKPAAEALGISVSALWARRGRFGLHRKRQKQATGRGRC